MASRPNMHARNSEGHRVSLLNDEQWTTANHLPRAAFNRKASRYPEFDDYLLARSHSDASAPSIQSSPRTPYLHRSDSYDSNVTNDPISPLTPLSDYRPHPYTLSGYDKDAPFERHPVEEYESYIQRPTALDIPQLPLAGYPALPQDLSQRSMIEPSSYSPDHHSSSSEPKTKRHPCRYRDTHNCEKSFTTSGHASRHSKIHTAEKAVKCTHPGCQKKFTRADNMKQHLETHNKNSRERARSMLTRPAGIQRPSSAAADSPRARRESQTSYAVHVGSYAMRSPVTQALQIDPQLSSMSMPIRAAEESANRGGLDALAAVAACQNLS
jgi:hypothetical protein